MYKILRQVLEFSHTSLNGNLIQSGFLGIGIVFGSGALGLYLAIIAISEGVRGKGRSWGDVKNPW